MSERDDDADRRGDRPDDQHLRELVSTHRWRASPSWRAES